MIERRTNLVLPRDPKRACVHFLVPVFSIAIPPPPL
jgi:hypothetical protein